MAKVVPTDMLLRFSAIASRKDTFLTSPVLSRTKTSGFFKRIVQASLANYRSRFATPLLHSC